MRDTWEIVWSVHEHVETRHFSFSFIKTEGIINWIHCNIYVFRVHFQVYRKMENGVLNLHECTIEVLKCFENEKLPRIKVKQKIFLKTFVERSFSFVVFYDWKCFPQTLPLGHIASLQLPPCTEAVHAPHSMWSLQCWKIPIISLPYVSAFLPFLWIREYVYTSSQVLFIFQFLELVLWRGTESINKYKVVEMKDTRWLQRFQKLSFRL